MARWPSTRFLAASTNALVEEKLLPPSSENTTSPLSATVVMAEATPEAFRPIARAQVLPAVARGYPAISDGFFYARNSDTRANELVCLDLR